MNIKIKHRISETRCVLKTTRSCWQSSKLYFNILLQSTSFLFLAWFQHTLILPDGKKDYLCIKSNSSDCKLFVASNSNLTFTNFIIQILKRKKVHEKRRRNKTVYQLSSLRLKPLKGKKDTRSDGKCKPQQVFEWEFKQI